MRRATLGLLLCLHCGGDPSTTSDTGTSVAADPATNSTTDGLPTSAAPSSEPTTTTTTEPTGEPACPDPTANGGTILASDHGVIAGEQLADLVAFRGIPYAAPPVGELRFRPAAAPACVPGVSVRTTLGPRCVQLVKDKNGAVTDTIGDEDCLTLNVWTPGLDDAARPILVFIHGGGNTIGGSDDPLYDGAALAAAQDLVVVTLNYRLGALGFLVHPELAAESPDAVSGNYAISDQIAALAWVQAHAARLGGDPQRVLLFGESAGAVDTCTLIGSPLAAGLFSRAIVQSGACNERSLAQLRKDIADEWLASSGCDTDVPACLRARPASELVNLTPDGYPDVAALGQGWGPHVDGHVVPTTSLAAMQAGTHNQVPVIFGSNAAETANAVPPLSDANYEALVKATFGPFADQVLAAYPLADYPDARAAYVALSSDLKFVCNARRAARAAAAGQQLPVRRYHFAYDAYTTAPGVTPVAFHGLELVYIFAGWAGVQLGNFDYKPNQDDLAMSTIMQSAWARFAATGDPGADLAWPAYAAVTDDHAILDIPPATGQHLREAQCDFWDGLLP
jgi:para-nitrobenzyl esterase